jgi:hypothetical protein
VNKFLVTSDGYQVRTVESSQQLVIRVGEDPELRFQVAGQLASEDDEERANAVSAFERLVRTHPGWALEIREDLLRLANVDEPWTIRMHVSRLLPLISWTKAESDQIVDFLRKEATGKNKFVAAWALDALGHFAQEREELQDWVMPLLLEAMQTGSGAVRVRVRKRLEAMKGR